MDRATRQEWTWAAGVALLTVALSSIPYAVGYLNQSPDTVFIGAVYDWEDYYSHLAKMQQGVQGLWHYRILFTPEDHLGAYINVFYVALGHLAGALGLPSSLVYHVARLVCAKVLLLLVVYKFVTLFVPDQGTRRVAYLLACFSSGLGWLVLLITRSYTLRGITPVDFWFIEMYTFFIILTFPHTCLALSAHMLALAWMVQLLGGKRGWCIWLAPAGAVLVVAVIYPYSLLPLDASLILYWLYRWIRDRGTAMRYLPWLVGFALVPLPLVIHSYRAISSNPVFCEWQAQSYTLSPPPVHYLLGYGLVLALAVWGGVQILRERNDPAIVLVLWPVAIAPLIYLPLIFHLQRRMIEGVHVPLSIMAAIGLNRGLLPTTRRLRLVGWLTRWGYPRPRFRRLLGRFILAFTTPSTWYLLVSLRLAAANGYEPLYHSRSEVEAVLWLGEHTQPQETVLSSYEIGGYVPARIGHRVFLGHWAESIRLSQKRTEAQAFYSASAEFDRPRFLDRYGIAYVFYGPRERGMGGFDPSAASYLEPTFQYGDVVVYEVIREDGA